MPPIFDQVDWGTPSVWQQTVDRLRDAGRDYAVLPPWYDVDDRQSLSQLQADLADSPGTDPALDALAGRIEAILAGP